MVILPSRLIGQPSQFTPKIDPRWKNVVSVLLPMGQSMYDVVQGVLLTQNGGGGTLATGVTNTYGLAMHGGNQYYEIPNTAFGGTEYTIISINSGKQASGSNYNFVAVDDGGSNRCWQNRINSSNQFQFIPFDTGGSTYSATSTTTLSTSDNDNGWVQLVTVKDLAASIWKDGVKLASSTIAGTPKGPSINIKVNARDSAGTDVAFSAYSLIIIMKSGLLDGEAYELSLFPYHIFSPQTTNLYVEATASGTGVGTASFSFTATGTGASTAASAGSATVTFGATGTGTGTFATSGSATVTFTPSAVGTAVSQGAGTATLTFTASGVGTSTTSGEGAGTADVTFAASAVGTSTAAAAGTATVTFNASGVGPTVSTGVGTASFAFDATAYSPTVATGVGSATFTFSAFGSSVDFRYPAIVELTDAHVTKLALDDLNVTQVELTDSATYKVTLSDIGNVS